MSIKGFSVSGLSGVLNNIPFFRELDALSIFKGIDFFSEIEDDILKKIADRVQFSEFRKDEIICHHGKFDEFFYLILSGSVRAVIPTTDNPKYTLFTLGPGEFFGVKIVLSSEPRESTIIVEKDCIAMALKSEELKLVMDNSPKIMSLMDQRYIDRKLRSDLRRVPIFTRLNEDLFNEVIDKAELLKMEEKSQIFKEGDPGESFYHIREGEVNVYKDAEGKQRLIAILGSGQFFGEMALIAAEKRNATVETSKKSDLVRIKRDDFISIVEKDKSMMAELNEVIEDRKVHQSDALRNPNMALMTRSLLDLNREVNNHLDIIAQCTVDTEYGSALLATLPGSRYPYVYPRDSACASRFLFKLATSNLKSGEIAFRLLSEISRFIMNCQREDGYWGQRYGIDTEDKGIYKQEDNVAHGVCILCRYLIAAKEKEEEIPNLKEILNAIDRGSEFARRNYYRNEIHLFYSTTSIHESAIEEGYSIWVNNAYLLMLRLIERVGLKYDILDRFPEEMDLKSGFEATIEKVFLQSGRYVRRLKPNGEIDFRPDITLMSPFFFGTGMDLEYFTNNQAFKNSIEFIEDMLWDPDLGMLQRYLPFIEDFETHIHAGNGPWIQYTAMLAQYNFYIGNVDRGNELLQIIDDYKSKEGFLCEHLTTPERFYEFNELEWSTGRDFDKEFEGDILVPGISYDKIVEELNHMKKSYEDIDRQIKTPGGDGKIAFATPLMWSHAEYAMALMLRTEQELKKYQ
jgi:CRP-like cAMP-binding protein